MSNRAMAWAIDVQGIGGTDRLILMLLAECHNGKTGQCNPGLEWLQERTGLKERALQTRLKALEQANLIARDYEFLGRGRGSSVSQYNLKIGIMGVVEQAKIDPQEYAAPNQIDPQPNAPALKCARKNVQLDPHVDAGPYKEEPEKNRKSIVASADATPSQPCQNMGSSDVDESFEEIWAVWSPDGRRRSESKSKLRTLLNRHSQKYPIEKIVAAAKAFAAKEDRKFHPGLQVWLRGEKYENWADVAQPASAVSVEEWRARCTVWAKHSVWRPEYGKSPDVLMNSIPSEALQSALELLDASDARTLTIRQTLASRKRANAQWSEKTGLFALTQEDVA